jgi:hypothetical protein
LEIINEAEQILEDNADSNNPSSAWGLQQPSEWSKLLKRKFLSELEKFLGLGFNEGHHKA